MLESELSDGQLCIDGHMKFHIGYGDKVYIDLKPEYRLKCIKFIMWHVASSLYKLINNGYFSIPLSTNIASVLSLTYTI